MFSYSAHLSIDVHCSWEQKKKKFIQPVNKIIKSLSSLSVTLSSKLLSCHRLPHAADRLTPHHTPPIASSHLISRRRSLAHQAANLKLIEAAGLKPMELANPFLLPTQLANVVLVCDWWFCLVWVEEKDWRLEFFFFFFPAVDWWWWWWWLLLWLWLMVEVVVVGAVEVFFDSGIYYFIVMVILFYCDVYIILLCWKIK